MTISTEVRKAGPFIGNDSASVFPFAFKVFKAADLIVVRRQDNIGEETTLILDSDYHVTLNGNQDTTPGGVVTLVAGALASGFTLVVSSELPYLQPTDLTNQGGFYPKVITNALDRQTIFCQQLAEITGRTLKLPITAPTNISAEIPLPNPSELIAWNETGTGLTTVSPQSLVTSIAYGSATADLFAGDGVTTTFPLTTNPASVNNLDVSIGGHSQRPVQDGVGDYSWNGGASITFVAPPPAPTVPGDKNVLVRYMQAIPVSDSEALHAQTREALRRGYAEAGYNLVAGSFETGGVLASVEDVLLQESTGAAYAWAGTLPKAVAPGFDPVGAGGFELRTGVLLREELIDSGAKSISSLRQKSPSVDDKLYAVRSYHETLLEGGGLFQYSDDDVAAIDDGVSIILGANGKPMRRINFEHDIRIAGAKCDGVTDDHDAIMRYFNKFRRIDIPAGRHVKSSPLALYGDDILITLPHGAILEQNSVGGNFVAIRPVTITEPVSYNGWVTERGRRLRIEGTGRIVGNGSGKAIHVRYIENVIIDPVTVSGGVNCLHLQTCAVINNKARVEGSAVSTCNLLIDTEIDGIGTWAWSESIISSGGGGTGVEVYGFPSVWFDSPVISNCNGIGLYIHTNTSWNVAMTYPVIKSPDIDATGLAPLQMRNCTNGDVNGGWLSGGRTVGNLKSGAELFYCRDTSIRGVKAQQNGGNGVLLDGCTDVSLVDVTGCNNQQNGAYIAGCTRTRVAGGNYSNTPERFQATPQQTGVGVYGGAGNAIHGVTALDNAYKDFDYGGDTTVNDCPGEYNTQQAIAGNWQKPPLKLTNNYIWIDANGYLRGKASMPTSDTDGVILSVGHM